MEDKLLDYSPDPLEDELLDYSPDPLEGLSIWSTLPHSPSFLFAQAPPASAVFPDGSRASTRPHFYLEGSSSLAYHSDSLPSALL